MIPSRKVAYYNWTPVTKSKWVREMPSGVAGRELLKPICSTTMSLCRPRGQRLVRTCITLRTGAHCVIGVKFLCTLNLEASCVDLIHEKSFRSPVTREKYRKAKFQVSIIPRSADLEFVVRHRGKELARVWADYAENLCDTEVVSEHWNDDQL